MNDKKKLFYHVAETAVECCIYTFKDGQRSIKLTDAYGKELFSFDE